jgi:hypothetical protein
MPRTFRKPLYFITKSQEDLYLFPISSLLHAVHKKDRDSITNWEKKGIIPEDKIILIQFKSDFQAERFYTEHTIRMMKKWFRLQTNRTKTDFTPDLRRKIKNLFTSEFDRFQGAQYQGRVGHDVVIEARERRIIEKRNAEHMHQLHIDAAPEEDLRDKTDWSIKE